MSEMEGIFYMRTRWYDSTTGRFMSVDRFGLKAHSKNFYVYCANNPVHFNDPRGTCPFCVVIGRGILVGAGSSLLDYGLSTPPSEWTWGGAAGAAFEGGVNGLLKPFKKLPNWLTDTLKDAASVGATALQKWIDGEEYSWKDAVKDFSNKLIDRGYGKLEDKYPWLKKFSQACGALDKYFGYKGAPCDWRDRLNDLMDDILDGKIPWVGSFDPNDMLGPEGYGSARFLPLDVTLKYTIRFENDENATAPAQRVYVEHAFSEHLDSRTFVLGNFGFGNFTSELTAGNKMYQGIIDLSTELGVVVQVFAGLDIVKGVIAWEFQTLDPNTGSAPDDPGVGFLPPNNGTSGQGYVTFSIKPKLDTPHLSIIHANASIYFDENEPIDTPDIFNTVDVVVPKVNGTIIPGTESTDSVTLSLQGSDSGSGIKHVDLFYLKGDSFEPFKTGISEAVYVMPVEVGASYSVVAVAEDYVGNRMQLEQVDEVSLITVNITLSYVTCDCSGNGVCSAGSSICVCFDGFYGYNCNRTSPPLEPPVLELRSNTGFVDEPIELTISARNISGTLEQLNIKLSGLPNNTMFSKGTVQADGTVVLTSSEFGRVNMTSSEAGVHNITVTVTQDLDGESDISRTGTLSVVVRSKPPSIQVDLYGCYSGNNSILYSCSFTMSKVTYNFGNFGSSAGVQEILMTLPSWIRMADVYSADGVYKMNISNLQGELVITKTFEPFNITVSVLVNKEIYTKEKFDFKFLIEQTCKSDTFSTATPPSDNHRRVPFTVTIDIDIPESYDLDHPATYELYRKKSYLMLDSFYSSELGANFIDVVIRSLRKGSLVIDHDVIITNNDESTQKLAVAVGKMASFNSTSTGLIFDDEIVTTLALTSGNTSVSDACDVYNSIDVCQQSKCVIDKGQPSCKSTGDEGSDGANDKNTTAIVIGVVVGVIGLLVIIVVVVAVNRRLRDKRYEGVYNDASGGQSYHSTSRNPLYDKQDI